MRASVFGLASGVIAGATALVLTFSPLAASAADKPAPAAPAARAGGGGGLPLAQGSAVAGLGFGDKPYALPDDGTFSTIMNKVAHEIQRRCSALEAFGWEVQPDDQRRVDKLTETTVGALRQAKFTVKQIRSSQVSPDTVVYTAERSDRRLLLLQSLSTPTNRDQQAQLVMVFCDTATR